MESTIWFTDGFVVITGEIGSGKTTLIETFLKELEKDVVVAQINQTQVSPIEIPADRAGAVRLPAVPHEEGRAALDAQRVPDRAVRQRPPRAADRRRGAEPVQQGARGDPALSGVETTKEKVLRIILAGQPELNDKLNSPRLIQLAQRIRLRFHLGALSKPDTRCTSSIASRSPAQGRQIFDPETYPLIYRYTGGIPRLVNTLCDTSMMAAFAQDRDTVKVEDSKAAVEELQWVEYAERSRKRAGTASHQPAQPTAHAADASRASGEYRVRRILVGFNGQTSRGARADAQAASSSAARDRPNDLQIDSKYISRHHAQIITSASTSVLEDLNSTNGILRARQARASADAQRRSTSCRSASTRSCISTSD